MSVAVLTLNFGEPKEPDEAAVLSFLERIFLANASLEVYESEEAMRTRCRELAERRAPGLLEEYRAIGGSPLNRQAAAHAAALQEELRSRGTDARVLTGMQFTEPFIEEAVARAREEGADRVVGLPVYPLCGESTTVAALRQMAAAMEDLGWDAPRHDISGWHRHPGYLELRVDNIRRFVENRNLDLSDPDTILLLSAHGTPRKYLEAGNRYRAYVEEWCRSLLDALEPRNHALGFQNHGNRAIPWTEPDVEDVVMELDGKRVVVEPVSFMHEQSETLVELDLDLREEAEERGLEFHRVPVPHDDPRFPEVLADLVEAALRPGENGLEPGPCRCRPDPATRCLNVGARETG